MTRNNFYLWLFYLLPLVYFLSLPIATGDLAVWAAQGKVMLSTGKVLRHDIFSILPTTELIYPVGTCLLYGVADLFGGLVAVSLFHKLALLLISFLWYRFSISKLKSPWSYPSLLLIFLTWFGSSMFWIDRPALLGMIPLILSFHIIQKDDLELKDLFLLNLINIVWANLHGSWIILTGMVLWREISRAIILKKRVPWQQFVAVFSLLITSLINPFGIKIFAYVYETVFLSKERKIEEWGQLSFSGPYLSQTISFLILCIAVIAGGVIQYSRSKEQFKKAITSPFLPLLILGIQSNRNTSLAFFVLIPFVCENFFVKGTQENTGNKKSFFNFFFVGLVGVCALAFLPMVKPHVQNFLPESKRAVYDHFAFSEAADYLNKTVDSDPVFHDWGYGSFLIYSQKHPIFIDTRNIIYTNDEFTEGMKVFWAEKDWESILGKYKVRYVILEKKSKSPLVLIMKNSSNWQLVIADNESVLFRKK